ncbi:MAG: hypothetical protein VX278_19660 [Myxococcota bacterium]|nr:hypothetical protein [Myxococcota bacterium]
MFSFMILLACGEKEQTFQGEKEAIVFQSPLRHNELIRWSGDGEIAVHSHVELRVKETTWMRNYRNLDKEPAKRETFVQELATSHNITNIEETMAFARKKGFEFSSSLPLLSMETTERSSDHLGAAVFTSHKEGSFQVDVTGFEVDRLTLKFVQPQRWELLPPARLFQKKDEEPLLAAFCVAPDYAFQFLIHLYGKGNFPLAWNVPQWTVQSSSSGISVEAKEQSIVLKAEKDFRKATLQFSALNVFDEPLFPQLPAIEICEANSQQIQELNVARSPDVGDFTPSILKAKELADIEQVYKNASQIGEPSFWKKIRKKKQIQTLGYNIQAKGEMPLVVPITVKVEGGLVVEESLFFKGLMEPGGDIKLLERLVVAKDTAVIPSGGGFVVLSTGDTDYSIDLSYEQVKKTEKITMPK